MADDEALTFPLLTQSYTVTLTAGPVQTVTAADIYLDQDFTVFTDTDGKVAAAFPSHTITAITPAPTGGAA